MKKSTIFALFFLILVGNLMAQKKPSYDPLTLDYAANTFYAEVIGTGGLFSINYDRRLSKDMSGFGLRAGVGFTRNDVLSGGGFSLPVMLNYLTGKNLHHFEAGVGVAPSFGTDNVGATSELAPSVCLAYRYHNPAKNGINFRVGLMPVIRKTATLPITPWAGVSFGYSFK